MIHWLGDTANIIIGTGFVINRIEKYGSTEIFIATANHVSEGTCSVNNMVCSNLQLFESPPSIDDLAGALGDIKYRSAILIKATSDPDLAVFKIEVEQGKYPNLKALRVSESCDIAPKEMTYMIGFPYTEDRDYVAHRLIVDPDSMVRRWSKGMFVGYAPPSGLPGSSKGSALITDDALQGNSGGPLFNFNGEVIGVLESAVPSQEYKLRRLDNGVRFHAAAVSCEKLKNFVGSLN